MAFRVPLPGVRVTVDVTDLDPSAALLAVTETLCMLEINAGAV
jgi:hypothetical protein